MDLFQFCEWLIYRKFSESDFAAGATIDGILHFLNLAARMALSDRDLTEYRKYRQLADRVYYARDYARVISKV